MSENDNPIAIEMSLKKLSTILIIAALFYIVALYLWNQHGIDYRIVLMHNVIYENEFYLKFFQFISHFGMGIISLIYSLLIFLSIRNTELDHHRALFLFILFTFVSGSIAGDLLKEIIGRARPVVELSGKIRVTDLSDTASFPSGHATKSMALALPFVIMASNKDIVTRVIKILVLIVALLVCYSRIALQKHFFSDVLAGVATALLFIVVAFWIVNGVYARRKIDEEKLSGLNKKLGFIFLALAVLLSII